MTPFAWFPDQVATIRVSPQDPNDGARPGDALVQAPPVTVHARRLRVDALRIALSVAGLSLRCRSRLSRSSIASVHSRFWLTVLMVLVAGGIAGIVGMRWPAPESRRVSIRIAGFALASNLAGILAWAQVARNRDSQSGSRHDDDNREAAA